MMAQPSNDDCLDAINISSVDNFCSDLAAFSNAGATPDPTSNDAINQCVSLSFDNGVWFSFRPGEPAVLIEINSGGVLGTLAQPNAILYTGSCTTGLEFVTCAPGNPTNLEMIASNLTVGQRYYLFIATEPGFEGSFQLCINDFIAPPSPESDCPAAVILCDKSAFQVESITTNGDDPTELDDFNGECLNQELASVWYRWTCDEPGPLTFTLTPNDYRPGVIADDLDFAVFELPNGINDCANKQMVRCMASGETGGCNPDTWLICRGPTGLSSSAGDTEELPGCNQCSGGGDDNFISPLMMESGKSYALVVMNFSNTGKGFEIEFGQEGGTFLGPEPDFSEILGNFIECDKSVEYFDASEPGADPIVDWSWNFGEGANPQTRQGIGPHNTTYESFGPKSIALTVESDRGCRVTTILDIFVDPCCEDFAPLEITADKSDVICAGTNTGSFLLSADLGNPEYNFSIDGGEFLPKINYTDLAPGEYVVDVVDTKGCEGTTVIEITEPPPLEIDAGLPLEIELGFQDTLDATIMPAGANVTYMWSPEEGLDCPDSEFIDCPDPIVISPGTTTYTVTITDEAGCTSSDQVTVRTIIVRPFYAPTVITPDTRDVESVFKLGFGRQAERVVEFCIFDRWGNQIYLGKDIELDQNNEMVSGWDGRFGTAVGQTGSAQVNPGVYVWYADVLFIDGEIIPLAGDVTIIK